MSLLYNPKLYSSNALARKIPDVSFLTPMVIKIHPEELLDPCWRLFP